MAPPTTYLRSLAVRVRSHLPSSFATLLSWRTFFFILLLLNLKSFPLVWHFRIFRRFYANLYTAADVRRALLKHRDDTSPQTTHPIFQPVSIHTHAPLYETDYNLHKSNSTYFSDLDESRAALATRLLIPGMRSGYKTLENKGIKGSARVALGSVHCSFHKEIKPYVRYECRSRVVGWDRKWLVIATFLVLPARKDSGEVLLASALSKYVVKKGRYTVSPEHCLREAGWLPAKPETDAGAAADGPVGGSAVLVPSSVVETGTGGTPVGDGIPGNQVATAAAEVKERLERVLSGEAPTSERKDIQSGDPIVVAAETSTATGGWDWYRIEQERLRGLKLAEAWLALDGDLRDEFGYQP